MKKPTAKLLKAIVRHHDFEKVDFEYPPDDTSKMIEILGLEGIEWTCATRSSRGGRCKSL